MLIATIIILVSIVVIAAIFVTVWIYQSKAPAPALPPAAVKRTAPATAEVKTNATVAVKTNVTPVVPSNTIGVPYHTSNADVKLIMGDMQVLMSQALAASCKNPDAKKTFDAAKAQYMAGLKSMGTLSCDQAKIMLANFIKSIPTTQVPNIDAQALKTNLTTLYTHAVNAVCVNGKVDSAKLGQLLDNMHAAVC